MWQRRGDLARWRPFRALSLVNLRDGEGTYTGNQPGVACQSTHFSYVYPFIITYLYVAVNKVMLKRQDTLVVCFVVLGSREIEGNNLAPYCRDKLSELVELCLAKVVI